MGDPTKSSKVPKPHFESNKLKKTTPDSDDSVSDSNSSLRTEISPTILTKSDPSMDRKSESERESVKWTLAEEASHFLKTNKTSSGDDFIGFIIQATMRRDMAGVPYNKPMEIEAQSSSMGSAAKPLSFYPLKTETALAALLKVKPEPKRTKNG